jgi:hypothetical protein
MITFDLKMFLSKEFLYLIIITFLEKISPYHAKEFYMNI